MRVLVTISVLGLAACPHTIADRPNDASDGGGGGEGEGDGFIVGEGEGAAVAGEGEGAGVVGGEGEGAGVVGGEGEGEGAGVVGGEGEGAGVVGEGEGAGVVGPSVDVDYDGTGIHSIVVDGVNLFQGVGGYYVIGSCSGADDSNNNVTSQGSDGHTMTAPGSCPGAPYSMVISDAALEPSDIDAGVLRKMHVEIAVGPLPAAYRTLSVPMDPVKAFFEQFSFAGVDGYSVGCGVSFQPRTGNSARYADIPTPCMIPGVGGVGVARVKPAPTYGEITGPVATIRRTILSGSAEEMDFINHPGTNNIEPAFHSDFNTTLPAGTVVTFVEDIAISGPGTEWADRTSWTFEAETAPMGHAIGRVDGDGWAADTNVDASGMLAFGPYAPDFIAGNYVAHYRMLVDNNDADSLVVVHLDISDYSNGGHVIASKDVRRTDFAAAFAYQDVALPFVSPGAGHMLEFRTQWLDRSYVREDRVDVDRAP